LIAMTVSCIWCLCWSTWMKTSGHFSYLSSFECICYTTCRKCAVCHSSYTPFDNASWCLCGLIPIYNLVFCCRCVYAHACLVQDSVVAPYTCTESAILCLRGVFPLDVFNLFSAGTTQWHSVCASRAIALRGLPSPSPEHVFTERWGWSQWLIKRASAILWIISNGEAAIWGWHGTGVVWAWWYYTWCSDAKNDLKHNKTTPNYSKNAHL
jgi:hypothetical protein